MLSELDALPVAIVRVTGDRRIDALNALARAQLEKGGLKAGPELDADLQALATQRLEPGVRSEVTLPRSQRTLRVQASAPDAQGRRLIVFEDVTGHEQTRHERDRLLQLASLAEVMPSILHELKNPLAGISAALELLVEDVEGTLQVQLHAILSEVRRLGLTLDGLGRFRHEVRSSRHVAIDLAIREAVALLVPQATARGLEVKVEVADMPLLPLEAPAIRSVIFNTMMNAMQACTAGQHLIIKAWFDREHARLHLQVSDTGSGMSPEVLARATELFFTTKPKGSGIGLALCKGIADAVSGEFHVASQPGKGTTVHLSLPITAKAA